MGTGGASLHREKEEGMGRERMGLGCSCILRPKAKRKSGCESLATVASNNVDSYWLGSKQQLGWPQRKIDKVKRLERVCLQVSIKSIPSHQMLGAVWSSPMERKTKLRKKRECVSCSENICMPSVIF